MVGNGRKLVLYIEFERNECMTVVVLFEMAVWPNL